MAEPRIIGPWMPQYGPGGMWHEVTCETCPRGSCRAAPAGDDDEPEPEDTRDDACDGLTGDMVDAMWRATQRRTT